MTFVMPELELDEWPAITMTPEEADKLLPFLYERGYSWPFGKPPQDLNRRLLNKDMISLEGKTIIEDRAEFYKQNKIYNGHKFKLLTFQDFIQKESDFADLDAILGI